MKMNLLEAIEELSAEDIEELRRIDREVDDYIDKVVDYSDPSIGYSETGVSKEVIDENGNKTDYTMYYDIHDDKFVFMLGDYDTYVPEEHEIDHECKTWKEANEWFNNYPVINNNLEK